MWYVPVKKNRKKKAPGKKVPILKDLLIANIVLKVSNECKNKQFFISRK